MLTFKSKSFLFDKTFCSFSDELANEGGSKSLNGSDNFVDLKLKHCLYLSSFNDNRPLITTRIMSFVKKNEFEIARHFFK
jgi:hypothetical protein